MKSVHRPLIILLLLLILIVSVTGLNAEVAIPEKPYNHVVDLANVINDDVEANLNRYLLELEQKTTAQMVVLTISSLEGESLEDLSLKIAHDKWKLGQKGKDNGVLFLAAIQDRKYRFEIGYGLEGLLPDSLTGGIGRQYIVPYFRQGDYSNGIFAASLSVIGVIAADAGVEIAGMPQLRTRSSGRAEFRKPSLMNSIFGILFLIGLLYMFIRHPRLLLLFLAMNMMGGGRRSGWGDGGGGGFGGGSFGGGGGGGFGGGGSSGSW